jgi:translocation and assembly module TamB
MRRAVRLTLRLLAALVGLAALLLGAVLVLGNLDGGRRLIESTTAHLSGQTVLLQGLAGRFPDRLRLAQLRLADPQGTWLEVEDLQLRCSPLRLLWHQGLIELLQARRVALARAPAYAPSRPSVTRHTSQPTPFWIHGLQIDRLELTRLELAAPLAGSAVAVQLQGSARLLSWQQASLQFTARRLDSVAATYRASAQFDAASVHAQLDIEEGEGGPLTHLLQLSGLGALSVHGTLDGPRSAVATDVHVRADALQAAASGTIDLRARSAALELTLDSSAITLRPGLAWQRMSVQGQWRGTLAQPTTHARLELTGLRAGPLAIGTLQAAMHNEGRSLLLDARAEQLVLPAPAKDLLQGAPLSLHGELALGDASWPMQFNVTHPVFTARGQIRFGTAESGAVRVQIREFAPLAAMVGLELSGAATLQAQLQRAGAAQRLALSADLDVTGGATPLAPLLSPHTRLEAALTLHDGVLQLDHSQLDNAHLHAALYGGDLLGALALHWTLALPDLGLLSGALSGRLSASGQLQGQAPRLRVDAEGTALVSAEGGAPGPLTLRVHASGVPQQPTGRLELSGTLDQAPLQLRASAAAQQDGGVAVQIERGDWKSAHAEGALHFTGTGHHPSGHLALRVAALADLAPLLGQVLEGSMSASAELDGRGHRRSARVELSAQDLVIGAQPVGRLQLRGSIDQPFSHPTLALQLGAHAERAGLSAELTGTVRGVPDRLGVTVRLVTAGSEASAARLDAAATLDASRRDVRLTMLSAHYRQQTVQLLSPALISFGDGWAVDRLRLGSGPSVLQVAGRFTPALDLRASVSDLTPAQLTVLLPDWDAGGRIDATAQLAGSIATPTGRVHVTAQGLQARSGAARGLPALDMEMSAQLAGQTAQLDLRLTAGDRLQLQVSGQAPLSRRAPIGLAVHGTFGLNMLNPILEAGGQRMLGQARIDADIDGSLAAPGARGTLTVQSGEFQDYPRGVHLHDISATLQADGTELRLQQFSARAGTGTVSISGTVGLRQPDMPVALLLSARQAQPLASDLLTATVDMDLKLAGTLPRSLSATGTVHVDRAVINVPNSLPPTVQVLQVLRPGQARLPPTETLGRVSMDLSVDAPRAVFVRGRGLDVELGGRLHVGGSDTDPEISGGFELRSGTDNLAGATLSFSSGSVTFNGTGLKKRIDPTLDFVATNFSGGVTSTLTVGGYADAPVLTLSSTPEMPQDEILSHLLFGVSVTQLTTLQIAQIGAALPAISGIGGSALNPLDAVQRRLRLDRLSISGGGTGASATPGAAAASSAASIEAGRYVNSRIYVGGRQTTDGTTQAQVQIDLTKQLKVQTTLGTGGGTVQGATQQNDPGNSVGLTYQIEY